MSDYMAEQIREATEKFHEKDARERVASGPVRRKLALVGVVGLTAGAGLVALLPGMLPAELMLGPDLWMVQFVCMALLALVAGWIALAKGAMLSLHSRKTMGIVESARHIRQPGKEGHYLTCTVKYEVAGNQYQCKWERGALSSADNYVGTSVRVHYDPNNPSTSAIQLAGLVPLLSTIFYGAFMVGAGALLYLRFLKF